MVKTKWLIIITFMSPMQRFVGVYESRRRGKKKKGWYLAQKHLGEKKKRSSSRRLKLTLAVQNRAVYYCRL